MELNLPQSIRSEKGQKKSDLQLLRDLGNINILIVGYGVVGSAFEQILNEADYPHDICDPYKGKGKALKSHYHTLHICYPCYYDDIFIDITVAYIYRFSPDYVIIHSTIGVYTLEKIWDRYEHKDVKLFHAPVRGVEENGAQGIKDYITYVGGINPKHDLSLQHYFEQLGLNWKWVSSYKEAALGKIVGTSWYGMIIGFANQIQKYCDEYNIDFEEAYIEPMRTSKIGREYFRDSMDTRAEPFEMIQRPINIPGVIRGHCVMPNMKFMEELGKDGLVDWIISMNNYMKIKEVKEKELEELQREDEHDYVKYEMND